MEDLTYYWTFPIMLACSRSLRGITAALLSFQGSRAGLFCDLSASRFVEAGLRIPFDRPLGHELEAEWLRAAVSPTDKSRKDGALRLGRARRGPPVTPERFP